MPRPNFLSGLALDRASHLRANSEELDRAWTDPKSRVLPVWRSKHLVAPGDPPAPLWLSASDLDRSVSAKVLLGTNGEVSYFAVDLSHAESPTELLVTERAHEVMGLREVVPLVSREEGALFAYANGMMSWHRRHRFCGTCGSETSSSDGGHVRRCRSDACGQFQFPRTDPAVIMLVLDGGCCLLGRQSSWRPGVYSTLAGFVEPGESLEDAVAREVLEETGVEVEDVHYHSSQPWPFPSSLMVGFVARATTREIRLQRDELEDARWFTREELRNRRGVELPSSISIARRLVEDWLEGEVPIEAK